MNDILPDEAPAWRRVEDTARTLCERYGYREIRVPIFEATELYVRGMGEVTDVVEKEMFRVGGPPRGRPEESGGWSGSGPKAGEAPAPAPAAPTPAPAPAAEDFSLRPEFTAGIVRAYREHGLDRSKGFLKVYSLGPLFRYERPQKGRLRQFHQINVEALGGSDPRIDVEAIALARDIVTGLGIPGFRVRLNSIGHEAPECRERYRELLRERLRPRLGELCGLCCKRFDRNIFRVLDCKRCADKTADLPPMAEHLCADCGAHFATVRAGLERLGIAAAVDARLVRGFDYYTRTVFEFPCDRLGAQDAIGGGGRYDRLIPDMGGPDLGACGFALGVERLLIAMETPAPAPDAVRPGTVYVAAFPEAAVRDAALDLAQRLRAAGVETDLDLEGRSLKAQMRTANKEGFQYVAILGGDELARGEATLKDLAARTEVKVPWGELGSRVGGVR